MSPTAQTQSKYFSLGSSLVGAVGKRRRHWGGTGKKKGNWPLLHTAPLKPPLGTLRHCFLASLENQLIKTEHGKTSVMGKGGLFKGTMALLR